MEFDKFHGKMMALDRHFTEIEAVQDAFRTMLDGHYVYNIGEEIINEYVNMLADQVGDTANWINWFIWENDFGKRGHEAGYDGEMTSIRTIDDLYRLITEKR